ncbi:MAG: hypothetical protein LUH14_06360 [Clostridiaceae bacterium]|nr:hypothetical protein [Clostridiaceae bacterium]
MRLVMSAFGSYAGVEEIDFTGLNQGLFLIAGDTGSGKSTIFDAIMFALFDTMSGKERKGSMMRSEFAREQTETFVEYTFSYGPLTDRKIYTIKRYPVCQRKSRRRNKQGEYTMIRQGGKVSLILPDGTLFQGKASETNQKIQEIIGLNAEQFSRIAMIAQGEFQELIMDKTGKRKELFAQIFSTEIYQSIEKKIYERYKASAALVKESTTKLEETLRGLLLEGDLKKQEQWEQVRDFLGTEPERVLQFLEELVQEEEKVCRQEKEQLAQAEQKLLTEVRRLEEAEQQNRWLEEYRKEKAQLEVLAQKEPWMQQQEKELQMAEAVREVWHREERLRQCRQQRKDAKEQSEEFALREKEVAARLGELQKKQQEKKQSYENRQPQIERRRERLAQEIRQQQEISDCRSLLVKSREAWERGEKQLKSLRKEQQACQEKEQQLKDKLSERENWKIRLEKISQQLEREGETKRQLEKFQEECAQYEAEVCALEKEEKDLLCAVKQWEKCRAEYQVKSNAYIAGQSAFLAKELVQGEPCPVCGSRNHPAPAKQNVGSVTREELERCRKNEDAAAQKKELCQLAAEGRRGRLEARSAGIRQMSASVLQYDCDEAAPAVLKPLLTEALKKQDDLLQGLEKDGKDLRKNLSLLEEYQEQLAQEEQRGRRLSDELAAAADSQTEREIERKTLEERLQSMKKDLSIQSASEGEEELKLLTQELTGLQAEMAQSQERFTEQKKEYDFLQGSRKEKEKQQRELAEREKQYQSEFDDIRQSRGFSEEGYQKALELLKGQEERRKALQDYQIRKAECEARVNALKDQIQGRNPQDITVLQKAKEQAAQEKEAAQDRLEQTASRCRSNERVRGRVKELLAGKEQRLHQLQIIRSLNDAANGKIHFQTYIQRQYFKKIIQAANRRLGKMTSNAFLLKCREMTNTGQGEAGLDLDVYNPASGKTRDARTLSGGETFLASLAMALGMSDVVQETVGKTHLDTIFIDEGFGSLSEEVRNMAVGVLVELAGGSRLVGVISHVTELKEQIPAQLFVTKGSHGSQVKWK